ncbi:MAG TPA: sigma 54-interacting transcriptional regulator [Myxococcaceae bacterium]|jgi:transcriptional regulator with GAF, ATPase, and Fis domain|nr:sigma 54-interacting transcriptional regulator [Myxococcaceae bacterium]
MRRDTAKDGVKLIGLDGGLRSVGHVLDQVAASESTVLLVGETGTGKELVARELHARSPRAARPFLALNCGAMPDGLLESELFGHECGAFTGAERARTGRFEAADGGTLLLDEVSEIPLRGQIALLRLLQEREFERVGSCQTRRVDVRVIAATNTSLERLVECRTFREDLYFRLSVVPLYLPPLRERREDLPQLAVSFLEEFGGTLKKRVTLSPAALAALAEHRWPGNVRELRNVLEHAVVLARDGDEIAHVQLGPCRVESPPGPERSVVSEIREGARRQKRDRIADALRASGGSKTDAARRLNMPRTTLHDSIRRLGLE